MANDTDCLSRWTVWAESQLQLRTEGRWLTFGFSDLKPVSSLNISQCFWCVSNHRTSSNTDKKHKAKPWLTVVSSCCEKSAFDICPALGLLKASDGEGVRPPSLPCNQGLKNHLEDLMESQPQSPRASVCDPSWQLPVKSGGTLAIEDSAFWAARLPWQHSETVSWF